MDGWAAHRLSGWSDRSHPGPPLPLQWLHPGLGLSREGAPQAGLRNRGGEEQSVVLEAVAGEEDWRRHLWTKLRMGKQINRCSMLSKKEVKKKKRFNARLRRDEKY